MLLARQLLLFCVLAGIIIYSTRKLARTGKALSELTSLSGGLIGFLFLSVITSMPEVVMSISAVSIIKDPDLCAGDIFGSNLFNITIIAIVEILISRGRFISSLGKPIKRMIGAQLLFTMIPMIFIFLPVEWNVLNLSVGSMFIWILYPVWTRTFDFDEPEPPGMDPEPDSLSRTIGKFVLFAAIIVLASVEITETCDRISRITGLGNSFLGALLLATVSSLPEITLSISLVRLNQASMAIGNLIGSNFFNIAIFPLADFFLKGSLYRHFSSSHAIPVFFLALSSTVLLLAVGKNRKFAVVAAKFMLLSYLSGMALLYLNS